MEGWVGRKGYGVLSSSTFWSSTWCLEPFFGTSLMVKESKSTDKILNKNKRRLGTYRKLKACPNVLSLSKGGKVHVPENLCVWVREHSLPLCKYIFFQWQREKWENGTERGWFQTLKLQVREFCVPPLNKIIPCDYPSVEVHPEVQTDAALRTKCDILKSPNHTWSCYFGEWFRDDHAPQAKAMKTSWTFAGATGNWDYLQGMLIWRACLKKKKIQQGKQLNWKMRRKKESMVV